MTTSDTVRHERTLDSHVTEEQFSQEIACECMVCDLPLDSRHEPIEWRVTLHFPGPYPNPGISDMLLCAHCKDDWVHGDWPEPYNNFTVIRCIRL